MNRGKLEVIKQEIARVNIDVLRISELKWTGMGKFSSDDYYKLLLLLWARILGITLLACVQLSSVTQSCLTLCNPMDCSTPGLPVHHQLQELAQTHVHWVSDAIQLSHPLSFPSPVFNLSQHQDLFQWVSPSDQVAKVLEFQLQHQSFQWIFRTDFL